MSIPKAFISYSHDSQEHKRWALELATRLRNNGIDAIIDQYELQPGDDVPHFMETHLESADKILMICTERYVEKANAGKGGVGYEKMIITSNLMERINENKIIPLIKQSNGGSSVPTFLKSKLYINFSKADDYEYSYDDLVRSIHNSPLFVKPPVGNNPFKVIEKEKLDGDIQLQNIVFEAIVSFVERSGLNYLSVKSISEVLKISSLVVEVVCIKLIRKGRIGWYNSTKQGVWLTEQGKFYAYENGMLN